MVPTAVSPMPTHHHLSALKGSLGDSIAFLFKESIFSSVSSSKARLTRLWLVGFPGAAVAVAVGLRVEVGSICGGL